MILEMNNIEKHFGDLEVLKDISFNVDSGEVVSIIGPSGSGKTLILAHQAWHLPRVDKRIRRVLITCFNLSLVGYIRRLLSRKGVSLGPEGVEVIPFYSLCERILGERLPTPAKTATITS